MLNYKYVPLAALCTVLIVYMSSLPDYSLVDNSSLNEQIISNIAHIPAYALLTFLWLKALERRKIGSHFSKVNSLILIGVILFAVSDEIHQSFVPGRTASSLDFALDVLGIFLGFSILAISKSLSLFSEE